MLPEPLHPAIVHFPIVLAVLAPLFVAGAIWAIRRRTNARRAWLVATAALAALALSTWVALQTGEREEDRVERVVAEQPLERHEEAGELFLAASAVVLLVSVAGFLPGAFGSAGRVVTAAGTLVLVALGVRTGHSGGELVYRYGAASAYTSPAAASSAQRGAVDGTELRVRPASSERGQEASEPRRRRRDSDRD
jgi:uncharacterized membrane protein